MSNAAYDVSLTSDVVLVCIGSDELRREVTTALRRAWPVRTAYDGDTASESLDEAVSVVLVDLADDDFEIDRTLQRRDTSGLAFEIGALVDTPSEQADDRLDGYVRKPVSAEELCATVERLHRRVEYDRLLGRYYAVASDYAEAASGLDHDPAALTRLKERLFAIRSRLDEISDGLDDVDAFDAALGPAGDDEFDDFSLGE